MKRTCSAVMASVSILAVFLVGGGVGCEKQPPPTSGALGEPPPTIENLAAYGQSGLAAEFHVWFITIDTLRADHVGSYGGNVPTPHLDRLARHGVRVERATGGVPLTLPSHASMFTGLEPPAHGVRHNGTFRLEDEHQTMAESLRTHGYRTGAVVGSYVLDRRYGLEQGFTFYDDQISRGQTPGVAVSGEGAAGGNYYDERSATEVSNRAIDWLTITLSQSPEQPFFLWTHYFDPHQPHQAPREYAVGGRNGYEAEIAYADAEVGRVIAFLEQRNLLDRTLIVFTSDHGEGLGEHGEETHSYFIYDSTMRVPWILSNPKLFPEPLHVQDRVAGAIDLMPTVLDLLGVRRPSAITAGVNVLSAPLDSERGLYIETLATLLDLGWAPLHGLFRRDDKFILAPRPEHYDVRVDPGERKNQHATELSRQLEAQLRQRLAAGLGAEEVKAAELPLDREQVRRLANLGYVRAQLGDQPVGVQDPKDGMDRWNRARRAEFKSRQRGRVALDEAIKEIRAVLQEDPTLAKAYYLANLIYGRAQQWAAAESSLRRALELSPRIDGWIKLGQLCLKRRDFSAAADALARAKEIDPRDGRIYIAEGDAYAVRKNYPKALAAFEYALSVDPQRVGPQARDKITKVKRRLER